MMGLRRGILGRGALGSVGNSARDSAHGDGPVGPGSRGRREWLHSMEVALMVRGRWEVLLGIAGTLLLLLALPASAQDWHGTLGVGYAWQNVSGSEGSFWTQTYEREGFWLDDLTLSYAPGEGAEQFRLEGFGFGGAEPDRHARLWWKAGTDWTLEFDYDRRASYFSLSKPDFAGERDDWHLSRYKGRVAWDGWAFARLTLDLTYNHRGGWANRPLYGMNQFYGMKTDFDRTMKEAAIRLDTKDLPVHLTFEQTYGVYETDDRWTPIRRRNMDGTGTTLLTGLDTGAKDKQTVPTSRITLTYAAPRWDVAADLLYSHAKLDSGGTTWKVFDLGGGTIGSVSYIDDMMGSARQDTFAGNAKAGFRLGGNWSVKVAGDYRESEMDSDLLGMNLIRMGRPGGPTADISHVLDEGADFHVTDDGGSLDLEYRGQRWSFWGGFFAREREVRYALPDRDPNLRRTSDGFLLGASYRLAGKVRLIAEYASGDFEKYIFRTDPQTVERFNFRLQAGLGRGWTVDAHARSEKADSPVSRCDLFERNYALGANVAWTQKDGRAGASFDLEHLKLTTDTGIFLPGGFPDVSQYGMNMYTFGAHGFLKAGRLTLNADFVHLRDRGATWPLTSWMAYGGATIAGPLGSEFVAFLRYRDYDEGSAKLDDFRSTRFGLIVRWRF